MSILRDIRVLDFGRYIAGPFCGALLGDLGADVIRVEKVDGSEDRFTAPVTEDGEGSAFLTLNRNKRGFTLNPRKPQGQEVLRKLVRTADVVIANLPANTLASMGLDYESLAAIKPDIILATSTAFGSGGPYGERVGFDGVAQAMSGNMHLTGHADEPMKNYFPYVDYTTGTLNALATLAALIARRDTGEGQHVEGCLLASALTVANGALIEQAILKKDRVATGNRGQTAAPVDVFRTQDGWLLVQVVGNPLFERWAKLMGEPHWLSDPRYATDEARGDNAKDISERMARWCAETNHLRCGGAAGGRPRALRRSVDPGRSAGERASGGARLLRSHRVPGIARTRAGRPLAAGFLQGGCPHPSPRADAGRTHGRYLGGARLRCGGDRAAAHRARGVKRALSRRCAALRRKGAPEGWARVRQKS